MLRKGHVCYDMYAKDMYATTMVTKSGTTMVAPVAPLPTALLKPDWPVHNLQHGMLNSNQF